jgi:hypothetical protein
MPEDVAPIEAIDITLQLAAAFGQGSGHLLMEADALRPAYDAYLAHIERAVPFWDTDALTSVNVMRALGSFAAHHALTAGRVVITRTDTAAALDAIMRNRAAPLGRCPLTGR